MKKILYIKIERGVGRFYAQAHIEVMDAEQVISSKWKIATKGKDESTVASALNELFQILLQLNFRTDEIQSAMPKIG